MKTFLKNLERLEKPFYGLADAWPGLDQREDSDKRCQGMPSDGLPSFPGVRRDVDFAASVDQLMSDRVADVPRDRAFFKRH